MKALILGRGPSAEDLPGSLEGIDILAINDSARGPCRYVMVTDAPQRFLDDWGDAGRERLRTIAETECETFVCPEHLHEKWWPGKAPRMSRGVVTYLFGDHGGTQPPKSPPGRLRLCTGKTTAYPALLFLESRGYTEIGLLGIDLAGHPNLEWRIPTIRKQFQALTNALATRGVSVYNLGAQSELTEDVMRRGTIDEFITLGQRSDADLPPA